MQDLKPIIAKNITALRQQKKMTQIELAEQLNYSDKAVSKWERGESIPDVMVLKAIANLFDVTLDYLLEEDHTPSAEQAELPEAQTPSVGGLRSHTVITLLSVLIVCFLATVGYVVADMISPTFAGKWLAFVYAVPVSMIVWLVFNSIWFNSRRNYLIISILIWSLLICAVLTVYAFGANAWKLLLLGIPGQAAVMIWSRYNVRKSE